MYSLNFLSKENDLNKLLKRNKRTREPISILFISLWDEYSTKLVDTLKEKYGKVEKGEKLYIVDSFKMPHSFVIFNSTKIPHLVQIRKDVVASEDYLTRVMTSLGIIQDPV